VNLELLVKKRVTLNSFLADSVESVTPEKLKSFRTLLNSTAMDILYYTSPLYRSEVCVRLPCGALLAVRRLLC